MERRQDRKEEEAGKKGVEDGGEAQKGEGTDRRTKRATF